MVLYVSCRVLAGWLLWIKHRCLAAVILCGLVRYKFGRFGCYGFWLEICNASGCLDVWIAGVPGML